MHKILHITESMGAGVLKYLSEITWNLKAYEHSVIYSRGWDTPNDIESLFSSEVRLYNCQMDKGLRVRSDYRALRELRSIIQEVRPDTIHLHSSKAGFLGRILTWFFPHIQFFYTPHCYSFLMLNKTRRKRYLYWFTELLLSQTRSTIIACSSSEYRHARRLSWFRRPILVENGMKDQAKLSLRHICTKTIIGVGRMVDQKNPILFIEMIAQIKKSHPDVKAMWIGDGPLRKICETRNTTLRSEVIFTGTLPFAKVIEEMTKATVFVQTSSWEGLPFSIIEAFSCGVPTVASNIESHRDIIEDGENGFLASDLNNYVGKLNELLNNHSLRRSISARARESFMNKYSIEIFSSKMVDVYKFKYKNNSSEQYQIHDAL